MKKALLAAGAAIALASPVSAQDEPDSRSSSKAVAQTETAPSPNQIVESASAEEWVTIAPEDLLVMTLAPDAEGNSREVIIQLMPAPFSQGWVENIRTLARARWYDGISVNRVQDNYVVQWGDPGYDNPESGETETKPLPEGLKVMGEDEYASTNSASSEAAIETSLGSEILNMPDDGMISMSKVLRLINMRSSKERAIDAIGKEPYSERALHVMG